MSDEISVEAAVAGEAAAAAVEEVQARETVTEAASLAIEAAVSAEDTSVAAVEIASEAALSAGESRQNSELAVETAVSAQSMAAETHESLSGLAERFENRFSTLEAKWDTVLNALQNATQQEHTPENSENNVTEVPVNDNRQEVTSSGNAGESSRASDTGPKRRRVLRKRR